MPVTTTDLAGWLQSDLDSYTATLCLSLAVATIEEECDTKFALTTVTYTTTATSSPLALPYRPVTAVSAVRVAGVTVASSEYRVDGSLIYRAAGFGDPCASLPVAVQVDLTYGYADVPTGLKGAVLETAGVAYSNPESLTRESIDDYANGRTTGGLDLTPGARLACRRYRLPAIA